MRKIMLYITVVVLFVFASFLYADITRYPYLQPTEDLETSVGVAWETDNQLSGEVYFGIKVANEQKVEGKYQGVNRRGKHKYYTLLTGLLPGTEYKYQVISDGTTTPVYTFTTSSSAPDFSFKILILADEHFYTDLSRSKGYIQPIIDKIKSSFKPQLILEIGDFADGENEIGAKPEEYENGFTLFRDIYANAILCPVAGNHDGAIPHTYDYNIFAEEFYFPENGPEPKDSINNYFKELNYSFNYGGIHFATLGIGALHFGTHNTPSYIKDAYGWLEKDLQKATNSGKIRNIIGTAHIVRPYITRRGGVPTSRLREEIIYTNILDKYNTALVLAGHEHSFQRTYPIDHEGDTSSSLGKITTKEKTNYKGNTGVIYQEVPSPFLVFPISNHDYTVFTLKEGGYLTLESSQGGRKLEIKSWTLSGVVDSYTIERDLQQTSKNQQFSNITDKALKSYPNPFNPECYIAIEAVSGQLSSVSKIKIYNILGQVVRELNVNNGSSSVYWDGRDNFGKELSSGMYFYEMLANNQVQNCRKMLMLK